MWHLYPNGGIPKQFVAVDGSVYEKMPTIKDNMQKAIYEILGEEADKLELVIRKWWFCTWCSTRSELWTC